MKTFINILLLLLFPVGMSGQAREYVVNDHGNQAVRSDRDVRIIDNQGTAIANGNSKMYHSQDFIDILNKAGYKIADIHDNVGGYGHTILECVLS